MSQKETHKSLEEAIDAHIKQTHGDVSGVFVTGWVVVASLSSPDHDQTSSDGYVTYTSNGLQHHSTLGLLEVAREERKTVGLMSTIGSFLEISQEDEEDNE